MGSNSYSYDANGNVTSRTVGGSTYYLSYDAENRLTSVSGAATASFVYDGDEARVKGTVNPSAGSGQAVTTIYVGNHYEVSGGVVRKYYYAGNQRVAMREGINSHLWLFNDHLGSTGYTYNATTKQGELRYKPFGSTRYTWGTTPTSYRYTGQREEASLGIYYYGARWYDPGLGRFIQPDTIVPNAGDAKSFDRYAYTYNNPLRYVDPTGHQTTCTFVQGENGAPGSIQCPPDNLIGGQTQSINLPTVTATEFGPYQPTLEEIIQATAIQVAQQVQNIIPVYNEDGSLDLNATIGNSVGGVLSACARVAGGVCGVSFGASYGLGGGMRGSIDVVADYTGHFDVMVTGGGGAYIPPLALVPGAGLALATHAETSKMSVAAIRNATIDDMRGWSGQVGAGGALGGAGHTTEWVFGRNSQGGYWHGLSVGKATGKFLDVHLTATYSLSVGKGVNRVVDWLQISK